jgi:hypothetical protein
VALDRYGRVYVGSGPTVGRAATCISGSGVNGALEGNTVPSPELLRNFVAGPTFSYGGGFVYGANTVISSGHGKAKEVGIFSPQYGGTYLYSYSLFRIPFFEMTCN